MVSEPNYQRVVSGLRKLAETMSAGERLPSIREIAHAYGVAVGTASQAITTLQSAGVVEVRRGIGAYIRGFQPVPRSSPGRLSSDRWGAGYAVQDADTAGRVRVAHVQTGECPAPEWAAPPLGLQPGDTVVYRTRQFIVNERPVQLATSYLPAELAAGTPIVYTDTGPGGSYKRLEEIGYKPVKFVEYLRARMPSPGEISLLKIPSGTPVVEVTRHAFTDGGRCVEVNRMVLDGAAYLLDYTFGAE